MMRAACLTCSSLVVNVHTKSFATIIPQYVSSYCFIEDDRAVASFHIWYFEGDILDLYLMTSQNIASSSLGIALELPHSNRQISIIFPKHISLSSCNSITYYVNKCYGGTKIGPRSHYNNTKTLSETKMPLLDWELVSLVQ